MEKNECRANIYGQTISRKDEAFNIVFQKVSSYAALAECVADAVDDIEIAVDGDQNQKRYEKLVELSYFLSESMEQLKKYMRTV